MGTANTPCCGGIRVQGRGSFFELYFHRSEEIAQIWAASEGNVHTMPREMYIGHQGHEWEFQSHHGVGN
jgi:hypothetical protein